ncbi:hypothetical protein F0562_005683 [Nyssa sinensis]|uniref:Reverse transcriptase RNase H-like domain-containing protein n=1 Tax=Nyssa sinensis TaxID=561372 RepID=A0A5J5AJX2_9ASTE|nr:hypothetical protein F0562_005683 [Nyssa sinensis]
MQERKDKGLCYNYDKKYQIGHRCSRPKLYLLEGLEWKVEAYEEKEEEETLNQTDIMVVQITQQAELLGISLHAIVGAPSPKTMRLKATRELIRGGAKIEQGYSGRGKRDLVAVNSGHSFKVRTDQQVLKHLLEQRVGTPFQQKWVAKLLGFDFSMEYRSGKENRAVDALSRLPLENEESDPQGSLAIYEEAKGINVVKATWGGLEDGVSNAVVEKKLFKVVERGGLEDQSQIGQGLGTRAPRGGYRGRIATSQRVLDA